MSGAIAMEHRPASRIGLVTRTAGLDGRVRELLGASHGEFEVHPFSPDDISGWQFQNGIDLLLVDSGSDPLLIQTARRLALRMIPIIALSSEDDDTAAAAALRAGVEDYLVQSRLDGDLLRRSIRYSIERHRAISEMQQLNAELERLSVIDPLTEILNRRGLQKVLTHEVASVRIHLDSVLMLLVDLDDFKSINTSLGHAVGDIALKEIARKLAATMGPSDHVARIGGDEFMILMPGTEIHEGQQIAERLRLAIADTRIHVSTGVLTLTASIAAMMLTPETPSIDEVLTRTHQILQRSKKLGGNRVAYSGSQFDDTSTRLAAQKDQREVLMLGRQLRSVKHPLIRLQDENVIGYEFLSRLAMDHVEMPENFFRFSAEQNILTLVDHHCLKLAVKSSRQMPAMRFHVNLYPSTIVGIPAEHIISEIAPDSDGGSYCIEISEQQILGDPSYLLEPVRELRSAGIEIAIDDVGWGKSCMESLVILEPDVIKIDKRCVRNIVADPEARRRLERYKASIEPIVPRVVVEGIETFAEFQIVRDMGFEFGQGYMWGKPA